MATPKALDALKKTKEALAGIKRRLQPVIHCLQDDTLEAGTKAHAKATVALSIGMMRYMGARLRGLDQGRKPDDPLRKELNNIRRVLAAVQKKNESKPKDKTAKNTNGSLEQPTSTERKSNQMKISDPQESTSKMETVGNSMKQSDQPKAAISLNVQAEANSSSTEKHIKKRTQKDSARTSKKARNA